MTKKSEPQGTSVFPTESTASDCLLDNNIVKMEEKSKHTDIGDVFEKFGKYQAIQFVLLCLPAFFVNMVNINFVFAAGDLNYRCYIEECESPIPSYNTTWYPPDIDRCSQPVLKDGHIPGTPCTNESFSLELKECTRWVYESNNTVVAELDLGCRPWLSNMIGTIHSSGMLVSMWIGGWLTDRFGRKPTLIFCVVGSCLGQIKTFATSYYMYVIVEFCEAAVSGGVYTAAMVIMLEICGKKSRIMSGVVFAYSIYFGECMFAVIGMFVPYWKTLIRIITAPSIFFLSYIFLIDESARWQILNGRTEEAKETLLKITRMNKINLDVKELSEISEAKLKDKFNIGTYETREGFMAVITSKTIMKRLLVLSFARFTASFVYYGLMINSVYLPGSKYINFLLSTIMSFPGELLSLYLMNKIGRKLPLIYGYLLCGALCVAAGYIPGDYIWAKITFFLIGKALIAACFTGAITYMMELFPTSVRGSLLGMGSVASQVGSLLAPLTPILNPISTDIPTILFGASSLIAGLLLTLTPETKDMSLMETIEQIHEDRTKRKNNKSLDNGA